MAKQLHKRFPDKQVKSLLQRYLSKEFKLNYILEILGIKRRRFFKLLKKFRGVNGKIKYPKMAEKSTHFFKSKGYGIKSGKAIESSFSKEEIWIIRRNWNVRSRDAYNN